MSQSVIAGVTPSGSLSSDLKCFICSKQGDKRCARCKQIVYCSVDCQRSHWNEHKKNCSAADAGSSSPTTRPPSAVSPFNTASSPSAVASNSANESSSRKVPSSNGHPSTPVSIPSRTMARLLTPTSAPSSPLPVPASTAAARGKEILRGDEYAQDADKISLSLRKIDRQGRLGNVVVPFTANKSSTVKQLTTDLCARLSAPPNRTRLWVQLKRNEETVLPNIVRGYALLSIPDLTLPESNVTEGKQILLEVQLPDGEFPIDKSVAAEMMQASIYSSSPTTNGNLASPSTTPPSSSDRASMEQTLAALRLLGFPMGNFQSGMGMSREEEELQAALKLSLAEEQKRIEEQKKKQEKDEKLNQEQEEIRKFYDSLQSSHSNNNKESEDELFDEFGADELEEEFDEDGSEEMEGEEEDT